MCETYSRIRDCKIGERVKIYDFCNLYECEIGDDVQIAAFVEIQKGAKIGSLCKIFPHSFICRGTIIEDRVFIGPGAVFTNDKYPRAAIHGRHKQDGEWECIPSTICEGATIGAGAIILPGLHIGRYAMVGAGAVVTKDVPDYAVVVGNPARIVREVYD